MGVTIEQVLNWDPCYEDEQVEELFDGREELTVQDILALDIPAKDKLWTLLREELIPANILHEFACRCAEEALKLVENPDARSIAAIEAKRKWLKGEINDEELKIAREAACAAAWAASEAASEAAWEAAWAASEAASEVAWEEAAWEAAYEAQLEIIKNLLEKGYVE